MTIGDDTYVHSRGGPLHLEKSGKTYFVTFTTWRRWILPPLQRTFALTSCIRDHQLSYWLHCAVIMPDHVHLIFTLYEDVPLGSLMNRIKNPSAHAINHSLGRRGAVWQRDYFDRILRADEQLEKKCAYVAANPVRAGLVESPEDYPWLWNTWSAAALGGAGEEDEREAAEGGGPPRNSSL